MAPLKEILVDQLVEPSCCLLFDFFARDPRKNGRYGDDKSTRAYSSEDQRGKTRGGLDLPGGCNALPVRGVVIPASRVRDRG